MTSIRLISLLAFLMLTGCQPKLIIRPVTLPTFDPPSLVPVAPSEVACLSKETYTNIVNRESLLRKWGEQEQAVIDTNNKKATQK